MIVDKSMVTIILTISDDSYGRLMGFIKSNKSNEAWVIRANPDFKKKDRSIDLTMILPKSKLRDVLEVLDV